jgi:hypothetical protein
LIQRLSRREFDEQHKGQIIKSIADALQKGKPLCPVVCGFWDYFGDGKVTSCSKCGATICIRPWLLELVQKHGLQVLCVNCVDPRKLLTQLENECRGVAIKD